MTDTRLNPSQPLFQESYPLNRTLCGLSPNIAAELMNYAREKGDDVISLAQGEGCMATPDFITEAAAKALKDGKTFYGRPLGLPELREEISAYYKRIYGFDDIGPERVFITTSGSNAMNLTLRALL
ncbi:MAG TPA: aminotransferase class I/II-fold pyridoxal phosphate-dependent enzyme, partial [Alphaproteobacteria bacterium]|nr:aminotransferase class I/II-fold pyridoxal phosphate-dependent enzyme [Alphaproteobacteria bacterium]